MFKDNSWGKIIMIKGSILLLTQRDHCVRCVLVFWGKPAPITNRYVKGYHYTSMTYNNTYELLDIQESAAAVEACHSHLGKTGYSSTDMNTQTTKNQWLP